MNSILRLVCTVVIAIVVSGCATVNNQHDPLEGFNRAMFSFNDVIDKAALKPAAVTYRSVLPSFMRTGVSNFFGNLGDVWTAVNNLLQGKIQNGVSDIGRVVLNSTLGLVGVLDIASGAGLDKHSEDFGQTLGLWGVKSGPYVVLPFFGSSTLRDTLALPLDLAGDPWTYKRPVLWRNVGTAVRLVGKRSAVLEASELLEDAALDPYEFIRDGYLQRRQNMINDGGASKSTLKVGGLPVPQAVESQYALNQQVLGDPLSEALDGLPSLEINAAGENVGSVVAVTSTMSPAVTGKQ